MRDMRVGFALCGSFCTFEKAFAAIEELAAAGARLTPIMSYFAANTDTRFGRAAEVRARLENICGRGVIRTIEGAEPIGPKRLLDLMIVAPCTGNTLAKLANGIADTPVTMAVKSHLRNGGPVLIAVSTNDALGAAARNIGELMARKNIYFVPMRQDAPFEKPSSVVADFSRLAA
ncbi:MAG: dipicolinate synthase subunit B, partial [Oscillospiraceae bacterium]|nr:dipicolinate synthase subunit B [Oscillospiraceae bacterium]